MRVGSLKFPKGKEESWKNHELRIVSLFLGWRFIVDHLAANAVSRLRMLN